MRSLLKDPQAVERYRHAVAMLSRAQEYRRTAVQHCDTYRAIDEVERWRAEVEAAREDLQVFVCIF